MVKELKKKSTSIKNKSKSFLTSSFGGAKDKETSKGIVSSVTCQKLIN